MNITNTQFRVRLALPLLVGASLLFAACGSGDDDADISTTETVVDAASPGDTPPAEVPADVPSDVGDAAGSELATACGLLDPATVDAVLGTSGVTTSIDTSLGLYDGCRWATATTDVPALQLAYDGTNDFEQIRHLACDGTTPEPLPAVAADAVACFGIVVAPAGTGVILVGIDDPMDQWDDASEVGLAAELATTALAR